MANINKSVVIQLADCGIIDIVTEFDEKFVEDVGYCPTCGPDDYYEKIQWANVITTSGGQRVEFFKDRDWLSVEELSSCKELLVTEADLIRLFLDKKTLEMLSKKTLEQFCKWLKQELGYVAYRRWTEGRYYL